MLSNLDEILFSNKSLALRGDLLAASFLYIVIMVLVGLVLCDNKLSVKDKLNSVGVPSSLLFLALALSLSQQISALVMKR